MEPTPEELDELLGAGLVGIEGGVVSRLAAMSKEGVPTLQPDEVIIGDDACPRCKGQNKAKLFAGEVRAIHDHLAEKGRHMWFWADRLIDGETTGIGEWEASKNGTAPAILEIPHDIVLCDWHYEAAHATTLAFALSGFETLTASWRNPGVALRQMDLIRLARSEASPQVAARLLGMLHTTWMPFEQFSAAYWHDGPTNASAQESVLCFREIMQRMQVSEMRLLPSWWLSTGLLDAAAEEWIESLQFLALMISNALMFRQLALWIAERTYRTAYSGLSNKGLQRKRPRATRFDRLLAHLMRKLPTTVRLMTIKDLRLFRRDPLQWSQVLIFVGFLVLYFLYIPSFTCETPAIAWLNMISFLNMAVVGLLLSTFTTRFIFPSRKFFFPSSAIANSGRYVFGSRLRKS